MQKRLITLLPLLVLAGGCATKASTGTAPADLAQPVPRQISADLPEPFIPLPPAYSVLPTPDDTGEREMLARIEHELTVVQQLLPEAQARADRDARVRFDYLGLYRDLDLVRQGVREHLLGPGEAPRTFPPLRGDYRR